MDLDNFDFELPTKLIAQSPARPRDHARLLVYDRRTGDLSDDHFYNLDRYLAPNTTLVLNDSKVEKSRLLFGATEIFVTEVVNPETIKALIRPGKKFKLGAKFEHRGISVEVIDVFTDGERLLKLDRSIHDPSLDKYRHTPFPPYIKAAEQLAAQYQTVYAQPEGSRAAPTAGLHFTAEQLDKLTKAHDIVKLTLHVGLGTFAPLRAENLTSGHLHAERYELTSVAASKLNQAKHLTAVGTTTTRVLETVGRPFRACAGETDIFIRPGYNFQAVDSLITNFHLPKSSLLMLVAAFLGSPSELQRLYAHAIAENYRFYSFGDAMLVL